MFEYDRWANAETLRALKAATGPPPRAVSIMAHVIATEHRWLVRLTSARAKWPVWPDWSLSDCEAQLEAISRDVDEYLRALNPEDLAQPIEYTNSKGEVWTSNVGDILNHVVFHSAYHRGQIASELRASGNSPAYTDFIHATRQGLI